MNDPDGTSDRTSDTSVGGMMQHLDAAKKRNKQEKSKSKNSRPKLSSLQRKIAKRPNTAILASNHPVRLEELVDFDAVTHRSSKRWVSAKIGVDSHGQFPIYYRQDGMITHTGVITQMILDPDPDSEEVKEFMKFITDDDTYSDYFDELDTTTYIVEKGTNLKEPFPQTELIKVNNDEPIDEGFSRQPSYVYQRDGNFPATG